jgi:hypothetical protein
MSTPSEDFALLIPAANAVEAKLSKELLESHGIPVLLHGMDRDMAELGASGNMEASHPDVYVPVAALKEAVKVLSETWENFDHPSLHAE